MRQAVPNVLHSGPAEQHEIDKNHVTGHTCSRAAPESIQDKLAEMKADLERLEAGKHAGASGGQVR